MTAQQLKKIGMTTLISYIIGAVLFFFIAGDQLRYTELAKEMAVSPESIVQVTDTTALHQPIELGGEALQCIVLPVGDMQGVLHVALLADGVEAASVMVDSSTVVGNELTVAFEDVALQADVAYSLRISTDGVANLYYGDDYSLGKGSIPQQITADNALLVDGSAVQGMLCYKAVMAQYHWFGQYYWGIVAMGLVLLAIYALRTMNTFKAGKSSKTLHRLQMIYRYEFLMEQLISKNFKNKYKRSVLGVFWSLLNPMLTMSVQYVIFSMLFKSNIPNFALYLIIGIVCFNFFNEAVTNASQSIIWNAPLITKVYMPKVIYPLSSVLSSVVNLVIALLPLLLVMLITWTPLRPSALLIVFVLVCLLLCALGFGLLLSALMVFFRDVQYLWGVVSMIWMYLTPIFYPVNILPSWLMSLMQLNPMYHFITFVRTILMSGVSPAPGAYLACIISAVVPFVIGFYTFKKLEDKFIYYL